jgi:hypothetical protein
MTTFLTPSVVQGSILKKETLIIKKDPRPRCYPGSEASLHPPPLWQKTLTSTTELADIKLLFLFKEGSLNKHFHNPFLGLLGCLRRSFDITPLDGHCWKLLYIAVMAIGPYLTPMYWSRWILASPLDTQGAVFCKHTHNNPLSGLE